MNLQYISDSNGRTTGVFIPINDWNELKKKFKDIDRLDIDIPDWHKGLVRERMEEYNANPETEIDLDKAMNNIEKEL